MKGIERMFKRLAVIGFAAICGVASAAIVDGFTGGTIYVDPANPSAGDGSALNPYKTVEAAVANAPALSKIVLAAGTYDSEAVSATLGGVTSVSRIVLTKKLYLLGAGRDSTFIVGADATTPDDDGLGEGAVRGILATEGAAGSIVEGLTIKGGRTITCDVNNTTSDTSAPNIRERYTANTNKLAYTGANYAACGGGIYFTGSSRTSADLMTMVDCSVEDCRAGYGGAAVFGNIRMVRCYVARCYAPTLQGGVIARVPVAFSSIFASNGKKLLDCADTVHAAPASYASTYRETVCVNCTFNGNLGGGLPHAKNAKIATGNDTDSMCRFEFYNCIFWVHGVGLRHVTGSVECYNCCQNKYGSLKKVQVNVLDENGQPITRADRSDRYYMTNTIGNVGTDYYPRLSEDAEGTKFFDSPCIATSGAKDYVPAIPNGVNQFADGYGRNVHLREGSILIDRGDNKWFTAGANSYSTAIIGLLPEEYRDKDFYGNARVQGGQVDQGAAEGGYEKGTTYSVAGYGSYLLYINGCLFNSSYFGGLAISGVPGWEMEIGFNLPANKELYALVPSTLKLHNKNSYASLRYAFPNFREKSVKVRVESASRCASETYTANIAASVKWVSPDGNDSNAGTEAAPYKTLQKAVNESSGMGVVLAKPGVYAEGGVNNSDNITDADWYNGTGNRVKISKHLRLVGVEGAEKTVIMGSATTATQAQIESKEEFVNTGCGVGAKRCVGVVKGNYVQVQGFTLTGGHVESDPVGKNYKYQVDNNKGEWKTADTEGCFSFAGAGVCAGTSSYLAGYNTCYVDDCIISNNVAYLSPALIACVARRCVLTENRSVDVSIETNSVVYTRTKGAGTEKGPYTNKCQVVCYLSQYTSLSHCLIYNNDGVRGELLASGDTYNSFYNNLVWERTHAPFRSGDVYNNIIYRCGKSYNYSGLGNICWPEYSSWTKAHTVADPYVGIGEKGRPMVAKGSPAIGCGVADTTASDTFGYVHGGRDIDGYSFGYGQSSTMPAGASFVKFAFAKLSTVAGENNAVAGVTGIEPNDGVFYANAWDAKAETVVTASDPRKLESFKVNGTTVAATGRTYTWNPATDRLASISPVYALTQDWYVDASKSDGNDGFTAATAKKTLNGVLNYSKSGDKVYVAEGVYDSNLGKLNQARINYAVAVVPNGVTLEATGRRDYTVIKGKWGTHKKNVNGQNLDLGDDAVRCLEMGTYTTVKGFTIYNGGTCNSVRDDDKTGVDEIDRSGAGAIGTTTSLFEDCFFTNLACSVGAACNTGATFVRCKFIRCGTAGNAVTRYAKHYNCYIDWSFDSLFAQAQVIKNCTLGPNNRIGFTSGSFPTTPVSKYDNNSVIENTLMLVPTTLTAPRTNELCGLKNCVFNPTQTNRNMNTVWGDTKFMTAAEVKLDAEGRLMAGSPAIDAGDNSLLVEGKSAGVDLDKGQRIYNGTVDIGAYEYDWRKDFGKDLVHKRITVTQASENVTETSDKHVKLVGGTELTIDWPGKASNLYKANFELEGEGMLSILDENGATLATYNTPGVKQYTLNSPSAATELHFSYTGTGSATLKEFRNQSGLLLMIK